MGKSQRLNLSEIRAAFRLVGEVCECGDDVFAWRARLTDGLSTAVGSNKGFCDEEIVGNTQATSAVAGMAFHGFSDEDFRIFAAFADEGNFQISPLFPAVYPIATKPWTKTRRELIPDDRFWYRHRVVNDYQRPADMEDCIHSRQPISRPGWSNMCNLYRPWSAKPFTVRDRRFVHLVHEELAHYWRKPAAPDPVDALPRRLGQVVRLFRQGHGEKQVAFHLGLSPQTIHAYAKSLYRRFEVSTRFDLLARLSPQVHPRQLKMSYEMTA